jgi:hypothetical protein
MIITDEYCKRCRKDTPHKSGVCTLCVKRRLHEEGETAKRKQAFIESMKNNLDALAGTIFDLRREIEELKNRPTSPTRYK